MMYLVIQRSTRRQSRCLLPRIWCCLL